MEIDKMTIISFTIGNETYKRNINKTIQELLETNPEMLEIYKKGLKPLKELQTLKTLKNQTSRKIEKKANEVIRWEKAWQKRGIELGLWSKNDL